MKLVEVYEGTLFEAQMVKNLSDNEGIESSLMDELQAPGGGGIWRPAGGVKLLLVIWIMKKPGLLLVNMKVLKKGINWYWKKNN